MRTSAHILSLKNQKLVLRNIAASYLDIFLFFIPYLNLLLRLLPLGKHFRSMFQQGARVEGMIGCIALLLTGKKPLLLSHLEQELTELMK